MIRATAADVLARAIDAEPVTVAKLLATPGNDAEPGREAWIVDEASMLSARDAARLLARAQAAQARLVLVGDVAQLGSVEAPRSFGQLPPARDCPPEPGRRDRRGGDAMIGKGTALASAAAQPVIWTLLG